MIPDDTPASLVVDDLDDLTDYANPYCGSCDGRGYVAVAVGNRMVGSFIACPTCIVAVWS